LSKTTLLKVYLPNSLWSFIRDEADRQNISMTRLVTNSLIDYFGASCPEHNKDKELSPRQTQQAILRQQRLISIVDLLKASSSVWQSRKELSAKIGCKPKTLSSYVAELLAKCPQVRVEYRGQGNQMYLSWKEEDKC